ncbi:MAG: DEAD/DEAH box helicase [Micromonosporaceae bacterium]
MPAAVTSFAALDLPRRLVEALSRAGIETPFPIQAATIPDILAGRDVLGRGQTGSGKTLAFGLPVLASLAFESAAPGRPLAVVLVPTRELANQVHTTLEPLGRSLRVRVACAVGGVPYARQVTALRRGAEVLVATPGRLADLIERRVCDLGAVRVTVLDEADQMCDMGFLPAVTELLEQTPADGQRLLFSASLDGDVDTLVRRFLTDPVSHSMGEVSAAVDAMDHHVLLIPPRVKFGVAAAIANRPGRTMMFVKTQAAVDQLVSQLAGVGVRAGGLHGGKTQRVRTRTLAQFREGTAGVLVATDVAARGIHVDDVSLVVHVDPPRDPKDYLHRAGRTARAGQAGTVVSLVLPRQRAWATKTVRSAGVDPGEVRVPDPDSPQLRELTGARTPSGVAVAGSEDRFERPRTDRQRRTDGRPTRPYSGGKATDRHRVDGPRTDRHRVDRRGIDRPGTDGQGAGRQVTDRDRAERGEWRSFDDRRGSAGERRGSAGGARRGWSGGEQRRQFGGERRSQVAGQRPEPAGGHRWSASDGPRRESVGEESRRTGRPGYRQGRPHGQHHGRSAGTGSGRPR